jgi:hypothetical protein
MLKIAFSFAAIAALTCGEAGAFVQAPRGDSHPQSELIIKTDWAATKANREARHDGAFCGKYQDRRSCVGATQKSAKGYALVDICKWQGSVGIINKHPGYCYPRGN